MISSWKEFIAAVERMRECQKEYSRSNSRSARAAAERFEAAVDACIKEKRAEWARKSQPELSGEEQK
jgi:hypothetical protein